MTRMRSRVAAAVGGWLVLAALAAPVGGQDQTASLRAALAAQDDTGAAAATPALLQAIRTYAAAACTAAGGDDAVDTALLMAAARSLLAAPAGGGLAVEAAMAAGRCLQTIDPLTARLLLAHARDTALAMPPDALRSAAIVALAENGGPSGLLPPAELMPLAAAAGAPAAEAAVLRAWARGALRWNHHPLVDADGTLPRDALAQAAAAIDDGRLFDALLLAAAAENDADGARRDALARVARAADRAGDPAVGRIAVRALPDPALRDTLLAELAGHALGHGLPADAEYAARLMSPGPVPLDLWLEVAAAYGELAYPRPRQAALDEALRIARALRAGDGGRGLMRVAGQAARLGVEDLAVDLLHELPVAPGRAETVADLVRHLAEAGRTAEAETWAGALADNRIDVAVRSRGLGPLAAGLARDAGADAALALLSRHPDLAGPELDAALAATAGALAAAGRLEEAQALVTRIAGSAERARGERIAAQAEGEAAFLEVVARQQAAALADPDPTRRQDAISAIAEALADAGALEALGALRDVLAVRAPDDDRSPVAHAIAVTLAASGRLDEAVAALDAITDPRLHDAARSRLAIALADRGTIERAVRVARAMTDPDLRLTTFRHIAEVQAHRLDAHGVVPEVYATRTQPVTPGASSDAAGIVGQRSAEVAARAGVAIFDLEGSPPADWPEITGLRDRARAAAATPEDVRRLVVSADLDPLVRREQMTANPYNEKFIEIVPILDYALRQGEPTPHLIHIVSGAVTLSRVREAMLALGRDDYLTVRDGIYLLQRPIVIGPGATLVLSRADVRELRMSTHHYAYLVNGGRLVVADTVVTSWDVAQGRPTELELGATEFLFRPFITAWSASETYATRTRFRALGYNNRKSWGMTASAGPQDFTHEGQSVMDSPQMLLVENLFDRLYYGFYSFHSHDLDLVGNEFRNNVIYGPDPHDYSDSILMALNTSYGVAKKHGLIVSREVSGLFIGNLAFDNNGAGIMLDRLSNHSIIYANTAFDNGHDGITVYETACAIVANNLASGNVHSGLRVRNSVDIAVLDNHFADNTLEGVVAYTDPLVEHFWRNLVLDPFWTIATVSLSGNRIAGNDGAFRFDNVLAVSLARNQVVDNGERMFAGGFLPAIATLARNYRLDRDSVMLADLCQLPLERYAGCVFRDAGVFAFDGQDDWQFGALPDDCGAAFAVNSGGLVREPRL